MCPKLEMELPSAWVICSIVIPSVWNGPLLLLHGVPPRSVFWMTIPIDPLWNPMATWCLWEVQWWTFSEGFGVSCWICPFLMRPMMRPMFFLQKFQYPLTNWQFPPIFHGQISYCFNQEIMWRKKTTVYEPITAKIMYGGKRTFIYQPFWKSGTYFEPYPSSLIFRLKKTTHQP